MKPEKMDKTRFFISMGIPATPQIKEAQRKLREIPGISVPGEVHLTLRFIGEADDKKINSLKKRMQSLEDFPSFKVSMKGMGAFPNIKEPRVVWIGADMGDPFYKILSSLEKMLDDSSLDYDDKPFKAHVTLGRVKSPSSKLTSLITENRDLEAGSFVCNNICLMGSELRPTGAVHSLIASYVLKD